MENTVENFVLIFLAVGIMTAIIFGMIVRQRDLRDSISLTILREEKAKTENIIKEVIRKFGKFLLENRPGDDDDGMYELSKVWTPINMGRHPFSFRAAKDVFSRLGKISAEYPELKEKISFAEILLDNFSSISDYPKSRKELKKMRESARRNYLAWQSLNESIK